MSQDGSKVDFTTTAQLVPEDQDTSATCTSTTPTRTTWTLVSQNGSLGSTDECAPTVDRKSAAWKPITPEKIIGSEGYETTARTPGTDDQIAYESGDIYFYSPEDLVPGEVGGDGQRNLYLYHDGHLQLVTTFEPGTEVDRATISDDGSHAAFMTKSSLTSYNSERHDEVYTYDAETERAALRLLQPVGAPPQSGSHVVTVSESGPFMSNDGRTFFATKESLVPQDTDGIRDIYEYTEGRAQLISSGTGDRDSTGGLETVSFFFGNTQTGLESVSRDGTDVYFSTFETPGAGRQERQLREDLRRPHRTAGSTSSPDLGSCAAADECHGAGSEPPTPAAIATGGSLGGGGNLSQAGGQAATTRRSTTRRSTARGTVVRRER